MFWYQCRYCKDTFDEWGKLVTHRRDEHSKEFEALKRRSAHLLRRQEEANLTKCKRISRSSTGIILSSTSITNTMKSVGTDHQFSTPPKRHNQALSKELDARDLENQEISLCIPISSNLRSSGTSASLFPRRTPTFSLPTPTSSPLSNGSCTPPQNRNGSKRISSAPSSANLSFLTPPSTPLRLPPSLSSPLRYEDDVGDEDWKPPVDISNAVQYHQMNDDDEIEICSIPSAGSSISLNKHLKVASSRRRHFAAPYAHHRNQNETNPTCLSRFPATASNSTPSLMSSSHIVIENLETEFKMTSSSTNGGNGKAERPKPEVIQKFTSDSGTGACETRGRSHVELLKNTGQRLKRLHSQLRQRQHQQNSLSSHPRGKSSKSTGLPNLSKRFHTNVPAIDGILRARLNIGCNGNVRGANGACNSAVNRLLRLNPRASARRPKQ